MLAFGDAERWAFKKVCEQNPKVAQFWLEKLKDPDRPEFIRAYFKV